MIKKLLITFSIFLIAGSVYSADQILTVDLEAPSLSSSASNEIKQPQTQEKPTPKKAVAQNVVRVGKVGVVSSNSANVYASKSANSRVYASVKKDTPIAVMKEVTGWYGILMSNGAVGWIKADNVKMSDYELTVAKKDAPKLSMVMNSSPEYGGLYDTDIMKIAMQYSGVRYVYGGNDPSSALDCSAFVKKVYSNFGVDLPRTARDQAKVGSDVAFDQLQSGDRLYFSCKNSYIDHCGIYVGNGYFVHCSSSRNGVGLDSLTSDFFWKSLVAAKR